eukprot:PhM_4_TR7460/c0_g1_i1/m.48833
MRRSSLLQWQWRHTFSEKRPPNRFAGNNRKLKQQIQSSKLETGMSNKARARENFLDPFGFSVARAVRRPDGRVDPLVIRRNALKGINNVEHMDSTDHHNPQVRHKRQHVAEYKARFGRSEDLDVIVFNTSVEEMERAGGLAGAVPDPQAFEGVSSKTLHGALRWLKATTTTTISRPHFRVICGELRNYVPTLKAKELLDVLVCLSVINKKIINKKTHEADDLADACEDRLSGTTSWQSLTPDDFFVLFDVCRSNQTRVRLVEGLVRLRRYHTTVASLPRYYRCENSFDVLDRMISRVGVVMENWAKNKREGGEEDGGNKIDGGFESRLLE